MFIRHASIGALVAFVLPLNAGSLLLIDGIVHTAKDAMPRAQAILVEGEKISYVGSTAEARRRAPKDARVVDLTGRTVVPGLTDAHMHLSGVGYRELNFNLEGAASLAELQARTRERASLMAPGVWLVGRGWIESQWTPPRFPTRHDLDAVVPDRPVMLVRADGHAVAVNSLALQLARVDRSTPNPSGGEILRDAKGEATGMLIDNAIELVRRLVPSPTEAELEQALIVGAEREASLGWTQVHIAGNSRAEAETIRRLVASRKIGIRIVDTVSGPGPEAEKLLEEGPAIGESGGRFTLRGVKLYIDGALGSRGAALLEPYGDSPQSRGLLLHPEDALLPFLERALRRGIQVQTHAIGDRGNRIVLDLYEKAFAAVPAKERPPHAADPRWRIEHAQVVAPEDIPRFGKLRVLPSMQPSHAIGDLFFAPARLGSRRLAGAYAWRSLIDAGAIVPGGSDAPVERGEPMIEFYAATVRRSLDGSSDENWHREQRVTRAEALKMLTLWPAYAAFEEDRRGTIEPGKLADLTVLSADLMAIPDEEILKTRALMTIVGGETIYTAPDF